MNVRGTKVVDSYKVVLIGDCNVGKTALVERLANNVYSDQYKPTIGTGHTYWTATINGQIIDVQLWDTAGEERFASLAPIYYKDSQAAMVVYSVDDQESAKNVVKWIERFRDSVPGHVPISIVCNKIDLENLATIPDLSQIAADNDCLYARTSAKTGEGVNEVFTELVTRAIKHTKDTPNFEPRIVERKNKGCC